MNITSISYHSDFLIVGTHQAALPVLWYVSITN